jgi:electron transport complex protein RnfC
MGIMNFFRSTKTFAHGIHPVEHKEQTADKPIRRLGFAPELVLPLTQHRGKPARPLVKIGQEVVRGEPIAEADGFLSVPLHAPADGIIRAIDLASTAEGPKAQAIFLKVHRASTQEVLYDLHRDLDTLSAEELIAAVQAAGLVGLGGAAFPSHVKMKPPGGRTLETLVVNGCECEPYLTCDHRVMLERPDSIMAGIRIALKATGARRAVIGVEDNKPGALARLRERIPPDLPVTVEAVETKYPQGAEKMLIKSLFGWEVPAGGLPADLGIAVYNVGTLAQMGELLPRGQGLIERVVTVSGPGIFRPGNYLVPIGTPLRFLLEHTGMSEQAGEVILGGPMMGMSVASLEVPITKAVSGVVVLEAQDPDLAQRQVLPCIKCGACLEACPVKLNPSTLGQLAQHREYGRMASDYYLDQCFECGSCAYVCPSNIPLTQYFRIAKAINREHQLKPN